MEPSKELTQMLHEADQGSSSADNGATVASANSPDFWHVEEWYVHWQLHHKCHLIK